MAAQGRQENHLPCNIVCHVRLNAPKQKSETVFPGHYSISFPVWAAAQHSFLLTSLFPLDEEHTHSTILINAITKGLSLHATVQWGASGSMTKSCKATPWTACVWFDLHQIFLISKYSCDTRSRRALDVGWWQSAASFHLAQSVSWKSGTKTLWTYQRDLKRLLHSHQRKCSLVLLTAQKVRGKKFCLFSLQSCSAVLDACMPFKFTVTSCWQIWSSAIYIIYFQKDR